MPSAQPHPHTLTPIPSPPSSQSSTPPSSPAISPSASTSPAATLLTVGGKYQINLKHDKLGSGGFGTVWSAFDTETGRLVAMKQIHNSHVLGDGAAAGGGDKGDAGGDKGYHRIQEIRNEITLMKRLDSEFVVRYIDHVHMPPYGLFIVMELLEGSLLSLVKRYRPISEQMVARYTAQILKALHYLHKNGIVHRDIKADNVLFTKSSQLKLGDFGIAQTLSQVRPDQVAGSPFWMAPEVIMMDGADFKSDIWSLGCLVIELLTGKPPYFELNQVQAFFRIVNDGNPPIPKGVSSPLFDFLMRCFNKQPELRKSAKELLSHPWITHLTNGEIPSRALAMAPRAHVNDSMRDNDLKRKKQSISNDNDIDDKLKRFQESSSDEDDDDDFDGFSSSDNDSDDPVTIVIGRNNRPAIKIGRPVSPYSEESVSSNNSKNESNAIATTVHDKAALSAPISDRKSSSYSSLSSGSGDEKKTRSRSSIKKNRLSNFRDDDSDDEDAWFNVQDDHGNSNLELRLDSRFNTTDSEMDYDGKSGPIFDPFENMDMELSITTQELSALERERELITTIRELETASETGNGIIHALDDLTFQLQKDTDNAEQDGALLSQYLPILALEMLTSRGEEIACKVLQLLNFVINVNKPLQEKLCLTGIFSKVCRFANMQYAMQTRREACRFVVKMITDSSRNLQTFIQCGNGFASLVSFLQFPELHSALNSVIGRKIISHTLHIITRILNFKSTTIHSQAIQNTQKNDFCRLMVMYNFVEHIMHVLVKALDAISSSSNEDDQNQLERIITSALNILFIMSYGDSIVKLRLTTGTTIQQLITIATSWPSNGDHKLVLMQCFRNICADAHTQDNVTQSGMIEFSVRELLNIIDNKDILDSKTIMCKIYGILLTILHNLCAYIDVRKEAMVRVDGAIGLLITIVKRNLKLSDIAAQLFIGIGYGKSDVTRRAFITDGGLECLLMDIMQSHYINLRANGLNVLAELLSSDQTTAPVEAFLIRNADHARVLQQILSSSGTGMSDHATMKILLPPLNTLMQLNSAVAQLFSQDDTFIPRILALVEDEFSKDASCRRSSSKRTPDVRLIKEILTLIGVLLDSQVNDTTRAEWITRYSLPQVIGEVHIQCERDEYHIPTQLAWGLMERFSRHT